MAFFFPAKAQVRLPFVCVLCLSLHYRLLARWPKVLLLEVFVLFQQFFTWLSFFIFGAVVLVAFVFAYIQVLYCCVCCVLFCCLGSGSASGAMNVPPDGFCPEFDVLAQRSWASKS